LTENASAFGRPNKSLITVVFAIVAVLALPANLQPLI